MFILLVLVGGFDFCLGFFELGQARFAFGHHQRKLGQLGLFFFDLKSVSSAGADLLLLLVDAALHLCGAAVALNALVQALLVADLLFEPGDLFARYARRWLMSCALACCACSAVCRAWACSVSVWIWAAVSFCCCWKLLMSGGGFVGGGQRLLPLHIIEQVLLLRELAGEGLIALGGFGLFFQLFHLAAQFALQIGQALQMLARVFQTAFGFFCGALYI